jgi:hypothetical protein
VACSTSVGTVPGLAPGGMRSSSLLISASNHKVSAQCLVHSGCYSRGKVNRIQYDENARTRLRRSPATHCIAQSSSSRQKH